MKIFIASTILFFCNIAGACACECNNKAIDYAERWVMIIDDILDGYEMEGDTYKYNDDFRAGFIRGKRMAYIDMIDILEDD